jgi:hypothetical protein
VAVVIPASSRLLERMWPPKFYFIALQIPSHHASNVHFSNTHLGCPEADKKVPVHSHNNNWTAIFDKNITMN